MKEYYVLKYSLNRKYVLTPECGFLEGHYVRKFLIQVWVSRVPFVIVKDGFKYYEFFTRKEFVPNQGTRSAKYGAMSTQYTYLTDENIGLSLTIYTKEFKKILDYDDISYLDSTYLENIPPEAVMERLKPWINNPKKVKEAAERIQEYFEFYRQRKLKNEAEKATMQANRIAAEKKRAQERNDAISQLDEFLSDRK